MATHSSILAWRIPWIEDPGRPQSMELRRVDTTEWPTHLDNFSFLNYFLSSELKKNPSRDSFAFLAFICIFSSLWSNVIPLSKAGGSQENRNLEGKRNLIHSQDFIPSPVKGGEDHEIARHGTRMTLQRNCWYLLCSQRCYHMVWRAEG